MRNCRCRFHRYARRGEVQAAKAADAHGIPFTLDGFVCPIEEVAPAIKRPMWFQLYTGAIAALCVTRWSEQKQGCSTLFSPGYADTGHATDAHSGMSGPNAAMRRYLQAVTHPLGRGMWA